MGFGNVRARPAVAFCMLACAVGGCGAKTRTIAGDETPQLRDPTPPVDHAMRPAGSAGSAAPGPDSAMQPPQTMDGAPANPGAPNPAPSTLADRAQCSDSLDVIATGIDSIYGLAVTPTQIYVGTNEGVLATGRDGGDSEWVLEQYVQRILADERFLFWSSGDLGLNVQGEDGASSVFLPSHGAIEGVSQDADSIYAISDGFLVRVSKQTRAVTPLVEGDLHWSGTAVDAEWVYFVTYGGQANTSLERVSKDGARREPLASDVGGAMERAVLLVDGRHVYTAGLGIARVALSGGRLEPMASFTDPFGFGSDLSLAQDDGCLYYANGGALICLSKVDGAHELVLSVSDGRIQQIAADGPDLYFGVHVDGPAFAPNSWIGRVRCEP